MWSHRLCKQRFLHTPLFLLCSTVPDDPLRRDKSSPSNANKRKVKRLLPPSVSAGRAGEKGRSSVLSSSRLSHKKGRFHLLPSASFPQNNRCLRSIPRWIVDTLVLIAFWWGSRTIAYFSPSALGSRPSWQILSVIRSPNWVQQVARSSCGCWAMVAGACRNVPRL